jgi:hypothetical protein
MHICVHTFMHAYMRTHTHTYILTSEDTHIHICVHTHTRSGVMLGVLVEDRVFVTNFVNFGHSNKFTVTVTV